MFPLVKGLESAPSRIRTYMPPRPAPGSGGHRTALRCYLGKCLVAKVVLVSELLPDPVRSGMEAGCVAGRLTELI